MKILHATSATLMGTLALMAALTGVVHAQQENGGARATANASVSAEAGVRSGVVPIDAETQVRASTTIDKEKLLERKQEIRERTAGIKTEIKEARATVASDIAAFRAEMQVRRAATAEEWKENRKAIRVRVEAWKEKMGQTREEVRVRLETRAKGRVEANLGVILRRFEGIVAHLETVSGRLESRIEKLQGEGKDMDASITLLAEADAKLSGAKEDIAAVDATLKAELDTETSKESIRAHITAAKESIKEAHAAYKEVIASIRAELSAEAEVSAESSN